MPKYINHFPKPLLDDLVAGRWLPVVGAGMSRNAIVHSGKIPLWDDLGRLLAKELQDYPYSGALDAISAYEHEYGRPKMIERTAEALQVENAQPGRAHSAFCSIPFDIVCTTNVDFLLERQYEASNRYCRPVIDEDHLSLNSHVKNTCLLKLHGDLHHPSRVVLTEEDYDKFLERYPLLSTFLANLLITRTAIFIGYSLDDPDFRQIWQVVGERLGTSRRLAYAIVVNAKSTDIARYARRGVRVINLPGVESKYESILSDTFIELREYKQTNVLSASHVTEEESLTELSLPPEAQTRLCYFALSLDLVPQFREHVFPLAERAGLVPVTASMVITPGDNWTSKVDAIMRRSIAAVFDLSTENTQYEFGMLMGSKNRMKVLVITQDESALKTDSGGLHYLIRTNAPIAEQTALLSNLKSWFEVIADELRPHLADEPSRLLKLNEDRWAVVSAITYLETVIYFALREIDDPQMRAPSLPFLLELAVRKELLESSDRDNAREWIKVRNQIVHKHSSVSRARALEIVNGVRGLVERIRRPR